MKPATQKNSTEARPICRCMCVNRSTFVKEMSRRPSDFDSVMDRTGAGSGCGSCVSEFAAIYRSCRARRAIEKHNQLALQFEELV